ncbi:peptidoglycan bridge formation glycyltransferase FemA/FemB family protein [Candidatus Gracilibacteria bacterium]|nr:peptidoglycan bridge formation glycyltransferase FemA/FemB family protein [Candidatus Gracilibacteria bacterium]
MSFWQTKNRGEMLLKSKQAEKVLFVESYQIEKRSIGLGQYGLFLLGFEISKIENIEVLGKKLIDLCRQEKCLFIQIETYNLDYCGQVIVDKNFITGYYKKFITPYTAIIDLSKTSELILSEMKPKGRYNIRLAEKKEIKVIEVDKIVDNVKIFYDLMMETTSRDGFSGNKLEYYVTFLETILNSSLLIAYKDDKAIAAGIFVFDKEVSIYYYGASTNDTEYRNLMAPYLLQWTAIEKAKSIGSKYYDFLGIASPGDLKSSLSGVTDFKLKLTKDVVKVSDGYIWVRNKLLYKGIEFVRKIKGKK